jgi:hypothetical protein
VFCLGAQVVAPAFLHLLHRRGGVLTEDDWQAVPQMLYFSAGTRGVKRQYLLCVFHECAVPQMVYFSAGT